VTIDRRRLLVAASFAGFAAACGAAKPLARAKPAAKPASTGSPVPTVRATPTPRPSASPSPISRGPAHEVVHGSRASKQVALTFHVAGDPVVVHQILRDAGRAGVSLTMLVVGQWLAANRRYAKRILAGGHDLGNHTWSHPVLADDDAHLTRLEIVRCRDLLVGLTGNSGRWFRPSGTPHASPLMLRAAGAAGYPTSLSYDVDPLDYTDPGADAVVARVLAQARGGSIVSLHTLFPGTAQALPRIITGLRARGLEPVAASHMLSAPEGGTV
jgi:peptidoglycan/xylan/chitin deacetylase (PgdA/CDA1 family)